MKLLIQTSEIVLQELADVLQQLSGEQYTAPCQGLSGNTIGQHVRHILDSYQCLSDAYEKGLLNYDKRKRDPMLETSVQEALDFIYRIMEEMPKDDKALLVECALGSEECFQLKSNYARELLYNLEHTIHHMALIRVGIREMDALALPETFGVAPSTIQYRKACVQ